MHKSYNNPILPGFYPDPSICRVGEDYYLTNSTFEYFPGLPIFHSRDLVHWEQIGHVLNRPEQLNLDGIRPSGGLYAPTIRHHQGTFYVINTMIDGPVDTGNFIVTAKNPAGPWSDPYWLEDAPGIDPSLLFDDDGRVWYVGNYHQFEDHYRGHCYIWLQELNLNTMQLTGPKYTLWDGAAKGAMYAEGPHLYKVNGTYYLMIAEGGTGHEHAVTIARSDAVTGPYEPNIRNPILTHRHLGLNHPIVGTGHADMVETQYGEWWMVCLAMRPYGGYYYNLGRETFLTPVQWEEGWPVVSPNIGKVKLQHLVPNMPEHPVPQPPACDNFEQGELDLRWNFLRTPRGEFWSLDERPGYLRLKPKAETIMDHANPAFVGRRQQHQNFYAMSLMEFNPTSTNECAGIVCMQNDAFQYRLVVSLDDNGQRIVRLIKRLKGQDSIINELPLVGNRTFLKVSAVGQDYSFCASTEPGVWQTVASNQDGRLLSTPIAGGFVGAYIGMYTSSNGFPSEGHADFDWFEYGELEQ